VRVEMEHTFAALSNIFGIVSFVKGGFETISASSPHFEGSLTLGSSERMTYTPDTIV